jgi:hypothetical protein
MKMLEKDPAKRLASIADVVAELAAFVDAEEVSRPHSVIRRVTLHHDATLDAVPPRRRRIRSAIAAGAAVAFGALALVITPKCVGSEVDSSAQAVAATQPVKAPVPVVEAAPPPAPEPVATAVEPPPAPEPVATVAAKVVAPPPRAAAFHHSLIVRSLPIPPPSKKAPEPMAARHFDPSPVVHGGLTGPGF